MKDRICIFLLLALVFCFTWSLQERTVLAMPAGGLRLGIRGVEINALQERLKEAGFYPSGETTGYFGLTTFISVMAFEKAAGLTVDGVVYELELQLLDGYGTSRGKGGDTGDPGGSENKAEEKSGNPQAPSRLDKSIVGYYTEDYPGDRLSYNSLINYSKYIDNVVTFSFKVDYDGNLSGNAGEGVNLARKNNIRSLLLVHNIGSTIETEAAHSVLSDGKRRSNFELNILNTIRSAGYDGVNIDLEGVSPWDRENYNLLLMELKELLKPDGYLLTVSIPAKTADNPSDIWNGAYDYAAIGQLADLVMLMTYDEHWSGSAPGPVASVPWVEEVLKYAAGTIPLNKLLMGIAAYGYDWSTTEGKVVTWREVNNLVSWYGNVQWDNYYSSPYMNYFDNSGEYHEVWFENIYSLRIKLGLVEKYNLAGVAIWRLGFEDEAFWEAVNKTLTG